MTKFIDITTAFTPKKEVKKTIFTHYKNEDGTWSAISDKPSPEQYANVIYLGQQRYYGRDYDLFKAWDKHFINAALFLGTKGDEEYKSI